MQQTTLRTKQTITPARWLSWALMTAAPFVLMGLLCLFTGHNVWDSWPVWSNELDCYRVLQNFGIAGAGYSGMYEVIPPVGKQSVLGIAPLFFYGGFVKLFGLSRQTIMLCNCLWLSIGSLVFCAVRKPKTSSALFLTLLTVCYAPLILYLNTSMPEAANYGLLMLYATFLLQYDETRSPWSLALALIFGLLACLYRIQYVLLFLPLAWQFGGRRFGIKTWLALLVTVILAAVCAVVAIWFTAPTIQSFHYHLVNADSLETAIQLLLSHTKSNLTDYFDLAGTDSVQAGFRLVYLFSILGCLTGAFVHTEQKQKGLGLRLGLNTPFLVVSVWLLGSLCIIHLLYETNDWWDFRMLAPVLWLTALCLFMTGRRIVPLGMLGGCLVLTLVLALHNPIGCFADPYRYTEPPRSEALDQAMEVIAFDEGAAEAEGGDPFRNTVRTDLNDSWQLAQLEPGLGLETGWFIEGSIGQSRWLLTDILKVPLEGYKPVFKTDGMAVYRRIED